MAIQDGKGAAWALGLGSPPKFHTQIPVYIFFIVVFFPICLQHKQKDKKLW